MTYLLHLPDKQGLTSVQKSCPCASRRFCLKTFVTLRRVCFKVQRQHLQEAQEQQKTVGGTSMALDSNVTAWLASVYPIRTVSSGYAWQ